jgi:hypothetical protein
VRVVRRDDDLVAPCGLDPDDLIDGVFVLYALQQLMDLAFAHLVHLLIRVTELHIHARVVLPVRFHELESHGQRRHDRDIVAELMTRDGFLVNRREREITIHVVHIEVCRRLKPRRIERDVAKVVEPPNIRFDQLPPNLSFVDANALTTVPSHSSVLAQLP